MAGVKRLLNLKIIIKKVALHILPILVTAQNITSAKINHFGTASTVTSKYMTCTVLP